MSNKIDTIEGIGAVYKEKLEAAGVATTEQLLDQCASAKGRKDFAAKTGLSEGQLLKWANMADLLRVKGVGKEYSELLEAAGVDTVKELATRRADNLHAALTTTNEAKKLARRAPNAAEVEGWIAAAKALDPKITH